MDKNDKINYSEFIAASINVREIVSKDEKILQAIFNSFDVDNTGFITSENLKVAFSKYGRVITDAEIADIIKKHDSVNSKDGQIDFEEFKEMLESDF
jgi:Ca2+-binding EF-hand superfamily protein